MILEAGRYTFNLDVGFESMTSLKIDGTTVLTDGQCTVSQDQAACEAKGCTWNSQTGACAAVAALHQAPVAMKGCPTGTYRASPALFGCQADSGVTEVPIRAAGVTELLVVPPGVKNFQLQIESSVGGDLQVIDTSTNTYVVRFDEGLINNQQRHGTYQGLSVDFSGSSNVHEFVKLMGVTSSHMQVNIMSYAPNPAKVKLIWSHGGLSPCPAGQPPGGCDPVNQEEGSALVNKWSLKLQERYQPSVTLLMKLL